MRVHPAAAIGLVVFWSSGFVGADLGTREASPLTLLAWRYLAAAALALTLLAALRARRGRPPRVGRAPLRPAVVAGLLCQAGYVGGVVGGVALGVDAGTAALVAALQPLVVTALAHAAGGERATAGQRLGLLLGTVGVVLVVLGDLGGGDAPPWAYLLPAGGMLSLSVGTVLDRRGPGGGGLVAELATQTVVAAVALVGVATVAGALAPPDGDLVFWVAVAWVVLLSTVGGYGCYFVVLRQGGPRTVSVLLYLTPPVTALWAWLQLGQAPGLLAIPGAALCALAVRLATRPARPAAPDVTRTAAPPTATTRTT